MSANAQNSFVVTVLLTVGVCQPASAQWAVPMPTVPGQTAPMANAPMSNLPQSCNFPGSQYVPHCNGRPDTGERGENGGNYNIGPIGPIEKATLPPNSDSVIAMVPDTLVQAMGSQNLPPMWMRVCRTNTASGGQNMFVTADGETIRLVYPRCTYVAFRRKVSIGTTSNDQATTEYQMLGRY